MTTDILTYHGLSDWIPIVAANILANIDVLGNAILAIKNAVIDSKAEFGTLNTSR